MTRHPLLVTSVHVWASKLVYLTKPENTYTSHYIDFNNQVIVFWVRKHTANEKVCLLWIRNRMNSFIASDWKYFLRFSDCKDSTASWGSWFNCWSIIQTVLCHWDIARHCSIKQQRVSGVHLTYQQTTRPNLKTRWVLFNTKHAESNYYQWEVFAQTEPLRKELSSI
jgi:hypothetical protein